MTELFSLGVGWLGGLVGSALLGRLREHRREPAGACDWLLWAYLVDEGVVLGKDGSLLLGWSFRGPDTTSATSDDLSALSTHVSNALLPLGNGWMLHWDAVRHPAPGYAPTGAFPDAVTALIDEERRRTYEESAAHFETETVLVATYLPPPDLYSRLGRYFVQGAAVGLRSWQETLTGFLRSAGELERRLAAVLRLTRLSSDEVLTHLHRCLTGLDHPVKAPVEGVELDSFLADQDVVGGWEPRVGQLAMRVVAIQGFPAASYLGMLDELTGLPHSLRVSHRVIALDQTTAAKVIHRAQTQWFMRRKGATDLLRGAVSRQKGPLTAEQEADARLFQDQAASRMAADASVAAGENASGEVRFCLYTATIVVMQPSAEAAAKVGDEIVKVLSAYSGRRRPLVPTARRPLIPIEGDHPFQPEGDHFSP